MYPAVFHIGHFEGVQSQNLWHCALNAQPWSNPTRSVPYALRDLVNCLGCHETCWHRKLPVATHTVQGWRGQEFLHLPTSVEWMERQYNVRNDGGKSRYHAFANLANDVICGHAADRWVRTELTGYITTIVLSLWCSEPMMYLYSGCRLPFAWLTINAMHSLCSWHASSN